MSNNEKRQVEKIVKSYETRTYTKIDEIKELDKKVKNPITIFAYVFGTISSLILGFGMSVAMQIILPDFMWLGIIVGVLGIFLVLINYPIYKKILTARKSKYREQILQLSNEVLSA